MESSIAVFLMRRLACEQPPTPSHRCGSAGFCLELQNYAGVRSRAHAPRCANDLRIVHANPVCIGSALVRTKNTSMHRSHFGSRFKLSSCKHMQAFLWFLPLRVPVGVCMPGQVHAFV